jgi:hypothetical protein
MLAGKPQDRSQLGGLGVEESDIKVDPITMRYEDVDFISFAQSREKCQALVIEVMKRCVP